MIESTLAHIGTSAVIDLLVRIVSCAENPSGAAAIKVRPRSLLLVRRERTTWV